MQREPASRDMRPVAASSVLPGETAPESNKVTVVTESLEMSSLDNRAYRVIQLPNKLEALLIHDPDMDMASASLDVGVGFFCDDPDMPGMAHALEHALFLGSKKYPEDNAYLQYIRSNSGRYNAYTSETSTNYFFAVSGKPSNSNEAASASNPSPLHGALDRLAQFFISPLFLASFLDRELRVVDLEHSKNLQSDFWRLDQLKRELSHPGHPFHKFGTGTLDTLKVQPELHNMEPRDRMIGFFETYYSANLMKLAVLGSEPLDVLETWVADIFSQVPNKRLTPMRWQETDPFGPEQLGMLCFAKPVEDLMELDLTFPMTDQWNLFESKPSRYLSHLLGHDGPGSISSYVKSKGWADALTAGTYPVCAGSPSLFRCVITLTEEGLRNYWEVVMIFFQYLSLLHDAPAQAWIFEEIKRMWDINFHFKQKPPAEEFTLGVSQRMQQPIPRAWLLSSDEKLRRFDPEAIYSSLDNLRPDNVLVTVISRNITDKWDRKEKWHDTDYSLAPISPGKMAEMKQAFSVSAHDRIAALHLPCENRFIPTQFKVDRAPVTKLAIAPHIIRNNKLVRTWFKKDDTFWVPKASLTMLIRSPLTSAANTANTSIFIDLVKDTLDEYYYEANLAGLRYSLRLDPRGLLLQVSGYHDKLPTFFERVLVMLRDHDIRDRFALTKERLSRHYHNLMYRQPWSQLNDVVMWLTTDGHHATELLAELPNITAEATAQCRREFLSQTHMEILIHGNLYKEDALALSDTGESILRPQVLVEPERPTLRSILLPPGSNYIFEDVLRDAGNTNHAIGLSLSIGSWADRQLHSRARMLVQMTREPVFTCLRTKEQLGYIVYLWLMRSHTTMSFQVVIQSEKHPGLLDGQIEKFLASFARTLADMSCADFETHKRSCINSLLEKDTNLDKETERLWGHIDNERFEFDAAQEDAAQIERLTKADMVEFYDHYIDPHSPSRAKLSVRLVAQRRSDTEQISALLKDLDLEDEAVKRLAADVLPAALSAAARHGGAQGMDGVTASLQSLGVADDKIAAVAEALSKEHHSGDAQPVPSNGTVPILIKDVHDFRASLRYTSGAEPFGDLSKYELGA